MISYVPHVSCLHLHGSKSTLRLQGSWPFVSARLQELPEAPHGLADDLESFMHVLNLCALKHLPHALSGDAHQDQLAHVLQSLYELPGKIASPLRLEKVQNGTPFVKGLPDGHPMVALLAELSRMVKLHYEHVHPPPATSATSACASRSLDDGVVCGSASGVPDFDFGPTPDEGEDAQVCIESPMPVPDPALSPLRDHSRMVSACMRAIRKVWPRVDRVQREKARGHRAVRKRTRTESGSVIRQDSRVYKKVRKSTSATCVNNSRGAHAQVVET